MKVCSLSSSVVGLDVQQRLMVHYTTLKGFGVQGHSDSCTIADAHPGPKQQLSASASGSAVQVGSQNQGKSSFWCHMLSCSCLHAVVLFHVWRQIQVRNNRAAIRARTSLPVAMTAVSGAPVPVRFRHLGFDSHTAVSFQGKVCVTPAWKRPADRESSFSSYLSDLKSRSDALAQTPVKRLKVNRLLKPCCWLWSLWSGLANPGPWEPQPCLFSRVGLSCFR